MSQEDALIGLSIAGDDVCKENNWDFSHDSGPACGLHPRWKKSSTVKPVRDFFRRGIALQKNFLTFVKKSPERHAVICAFYLPWGFHGIQVMYSSNGFNGGESAGAGVAQVSYLSSAGFKG
ncbi:MAG: hypothetical protein LBB26_03115 [Puniceicoccales bacterium]|nr:hypothetical protein [Puniceicoccales bacterium]